MQTFQNAPLKKLNTLAISSTSPLLYLPENIEDLKNLAPVYEKAFYVIGEGSNTLFTEDLAPVIIKPNFKGIDITSDANFYFVRIAASENWHNLVLTLTDKKIFGLENLALIPGTVGAAPVQNIGAYGVEFSQLCYEVSWFDFSSLTVQKYSNKECEFSYRESIFKQSLSQKGLITEVVLKLPKAWSPCLNYNGLKDLPANAEAIDILNKVVSIRKAKLPDPKVIPNAGSFFKNPVVTKETFDLLKVKYPDMPYYPQTNDNYKLAAGWLIEQSGLKGVEINGAAVHKKQALVIVNLANDKGINVVSLAKKVQQTVENKFNLSLEPEVRMVSSQGVCKINEISQQHV